MIWVVAIWIVVIIGFIVIGGLFFSVMEAVAEHNKKIAHMRERINELHEVVTKIKVKGVTHDGERDTKTDIS